MRLKTFWLIVFLACWPLAAPAQNANDALVRQLYGKSGLQIQVNQIPGAVQQAFDQRLGADRSAQYLERKVISSLRKSLQSVFVPAIMEKTILKELAARLSNDHIKQALTWLDSPPGRKITRLEEKTATPEAMREFAPFVQSLRSKPPSQKRVLTIARLDKATKATQTTTDVTIASALATVAAFGAISPIQREIGRAHV